MDALSAKSIEFLTTQKELIINSCCEFDTHENTESSEEINSDLVKKGMSFALEGLIAAIRLQNAGILNQQGQWASSHLPTRGFKPEQLSGYMNNLSEAVRKHASKEVFGRIETYLTQLMSSM